MNKEDIELHNSKYELAMEEALDFASQGLFSSTLKCAVDAWKHIAGMMQYSRKYDKKKGNIEIEAIEIVIEYAPLLLNFEILEETECFIKANRRLDKTYKKTLSEKIINAQVLLNISYNLWDCLEKEQKCSIERLKEKFDSAFIACKKIIDQWILMEIINQEFNELGCFLSLKTRMDVIAKAKCSNCGSIQEAPKAMFLIPSKCPECSFASKFVILN